MCPQTPAAPNDMAVAIVPTYPQNAQDSIEERTEEEAERPRKRVKLDPISFS